MNVTSLLSQLQSFGSQDSSGSGGGGGVEEQAAIAKQLQVDGMKLNNQVKYDNNYSTSAQKRQ